jgi:hypothetical protein
MLIFNEGQRFSSLHLNAMEKVGFVVEWDFGTLWGRIIYANGFPFGVYSSILSAIEFDLEKNESLPLAFSLNKVVLLRVVYLFHVLSFINFIFFIKVFYATHTILFMFIGVGTWLLLLLVSNLASSKPNLHLTILQLG